MTLKKCSVLFVFFVMTFNAVMLQASETIKVAFGDALAHWVMPEMDEGIIVEIIEQAMEPLGYNHRKSLFTLCSPY